MKNEEKQAPKNNKPNSHEKDVLSSGRTYWLAVVIACTVFCIQMLVSMCLVDGPDSWLEFI